MGHCALWEGNGFELFKRPQVLLFEGLNGREQFHLPVFFPEGEPVGRGEHFLCTGEETREWDGLDLGLVEVELVAFQVLVGQE